MGLTSTTIMCDPWTLRSRPQDADTASVLSRPAKTRDWLSADQREWEYEYWSKNWNMVSWSGEGVKYHQRQAASIGHVEHHPAQHAPLL